MVYRVEHRTGKTGPYYHPSYDVLTPEEDNLRNRAIEDHADDEHPEPWEDGLELMSSNEFCCFTSLEALCEWFSETDLDLLYRAGYGVFPFEVDEDFVREGRRQALFFRSSAVRMDELEPVSA